MYWKIKAAIQNSVGLLPAKLSYPTYYMMQQWFGGIRNLNPNEDLEKTAAFIRAIRTQGRQITDCRLLEIGTGRTAGVAIGLWLCGAGSIETIDLNPYLKEELALEMIRYITTHPQQIREIVGDSALEPLFEERLALLDGVRNLDDLLRVTRITYRSPADARSLPIASGSIDFHISTNVLEHVPPEDIRRIVAEARRLLKPNGLFVHLIDLSDHFAHSDDSITRINFLQFDENQWNRLAGNRFMYHNRLRVGEFRALFAEHGPRILWEETLRCDRSIEALRNGFELSRRFQGERPEDLATCIFNVVGTFDAS